jgi:hypothetical protein
MGQESNNGRREHTDLKQSIRQVLLTGFISASAEGTGKAR